MEPSEGWGTLYEADVFQTAAALTLAEFERSFADEMAGAPLSAVPGVTAAERVQRPSSD